MAVTLLGFAAAWVSGFFAGTGAFDVTTTCFTVRTMLEPPGTRTARIPRHPALLLTTFAQSPATDLELPAAIDHAHPLINDYVWQKFYCMTARGG
jgi:hypothetical protein